VYNRAQGHVLLIFSLNIDKSAWETSLPSLRHTDRSAIGPGRALSQNDRPERHVAKSAQLESRIDIEANVDENEAATDGYRESVRGAYCNRDTTVQCAWSLAGPREAGPHRAWYGAGRHVSRHARACTHRPPTDTGMTARQRLGERRCQRASERRGWLSTPLIIFDQAIQRVQRADCAAGSVPYSNHGSAN